MSLIAEQENKDKDETISSTLTQIEKVHLDDLDLYVVTFTVLVTSVLL